MPSLAQRQLELLRRTADLEPPPCVIGGYAEDALLAGTVTRLHNDVDWLLPRRELELRLAQAVELGFDGFQTWGEAAPGVPFYLSGENAGLRLELGIVDEEDGELWISVHKLFFDLDGKEPPAGYRVLMPSDTFVQAPVELDGIEIWTASPLALYQLRAGIASRGSFGALSEQQLQSLKRLREWFFPGRSEEELLPRIEPLA